MTISQHVFQDVYHRLMARFDACTDEATRDIVRNCYERIMGYGNRKRLTPWFYR